jgi:hypothetical protein
VTTPGTSKTNEAKTKAAVNERIGDEMTSDVSDYAQTLGARTSPGRCRRIFHQPLSVRLACCFPGCPTVQLGSVRYNLLARKRA